MQKSKAQSPVRFLPSLPETRRKPVWQDTPAFKLIKNGEVEEITPLGASPSKKSKNGKGIGKTENGNAQNGSAGQNKSLVKTVNIQRKTENHSENPWSILLCTMTPLLAPQKCLQ